MGSVRIRCHVLVENSSAEGFHVKRRDGPRYYRQPQCFLLIAGSGKHVSNALKPQVPQRIILGHLEAGSADIAIISILEEEEHEEEEQRCEIRWTKRVG